MKGNFVRHVPTMLSVVGTAGIIATTVLAIKATPKALRLLELGEDAKGEKLTKWEMVRLAGPTYIPTVTTGILTIACVLGADRLNKKQQATLITACALANNAYRDYKDKTTEMLGPDIDARIRESVMKDKLKEAHDSDSEDKQLFFDMGTGQYFESTLEFVKMADGLECHIVDISPIS